MARGRYKIVPYSRDYRRAPRWGMGLPPRRPRHWWHRFADPQIYLRAVIGFSVLALLIIPLLADGALAVARPIASGSDACRVVHVVDGDTADIWCNGTGRERVRFIGFDAPELFSPACATEFVAAQKAKWTLRAILFASSDLRLQRGKEDRYDRRLVTLWIGTDLLSQRMIKGGHARAYSGGQRKGWCA